MKSAIQVAALLAVVIGGIFGVTFVTQNIRKPAGTAGTTPVGPVPIKKLLDLGGNIKKADWGAVMNIPGYESLEVEKGTKGHYDFLVANTTDKPVSLILQKQYSCVCASLRIEFGLVPDDGRAKLAAEHPSSFEPNPTRPLPFGPQLEPYLAGVQWTMLTTDRNGAPSDPVTIPAADAVGPRYVVIRFEWEATAIKSTLMKGDFVARQGPAADYVSFEVPLTVCLPVVATTDTLEIGDLNPGDTRHESLVIWSPTRDHFEASAQLATDDPCIQVSPPRPLSAKELEALPGQLRDRGATKGITRTRSAYEISVTVHEQLGEAQLELGPLNRRMVVNGESDSEFAVRISGMVRGPINVGEEKDRDRIDLQMFRADHRAEKMVTITSLIPGLTLSIDHIQPASIQAELKPSTAGASARWKLIIVVPPNTQAGPLPSDSAIYLKMNTNPPRRVRIPITGNASG
jgi:hypothetical protein